MAKKVVVPSPSYWPQKQQLVEVKLKSGVCLFLTQQGNGHIKVSNLRRHAKLQRPCVWNLVFSSGAYVWQSNIVKKTKQS